MSLLNHCHGEKKVHENEYITIQDSVPSPCPFETDRRFHETILK